METLILVVCFLWIVSILCEKLDHPDPPRSTEDIVAQAVLEAEMKAMAERIGISMDDDDDDDDDYVYDGLEYESPSVAEPSAVQLAFKF